MGKGRLLKLNIMPLAIVIAVFLALPQVISPYIVTLLFLIFTNITLAESFDILMGYTGYINMGHASFFGLGAYVMAILFVRNIDVTLAFITSIIVTVAFALALSYPLFRLRHDYFAVGSFALLLLMGLLVDNPDLKWLTGGPHGISLTPESRIMLAYYSGFIIMLVAILTYYMIGRSKIGLALTSIREDEDVAQVFGINAYKYKAFAMMVSSSFAGAIGAIFTLYINFIDPRTVFGLEIGLTPVAMAMLGGTGAIYGPPIGALILLLIDEVILTKTPYLHLFTFGAILAIVGMLMPGGIVRSRWLLAVPSKMRGSRRLRKPHTPTLQIKR